MAELESLDPCERAQVFASLRLWQEEVGARRLHARLDRRFGGIHQMNRKEIDALCDRLVHWREDADAKGGDARNGAATRREREIAQVIAALRLWQVEMGVHRLRKNLDIFFGDLDPLVDREINGLCERMMGDGRPRMSA